MMGDMADDLASMFDEDDFEMDEDEEDYEGQNQEMRERRIAEHGVWEGREGPVHINKMETGHLINSMRMIEKCTWGKVGKFPPAQKRKMIYIAIRANKAYLALEVELEKRLKSGTVQLGHFLQGTKQHSRKITLGR